MQDRFFDLVDRLSRGLRAEEVLLASTEQETSDFVRWNHGRIRQSGTVDQGYLQLQLVRRDRSAAVALTLAGDPSLDLERSRRAIDQLRDRLEFVPSDPHLSYAAEVHSTERVSPDELPPVDDVLSAVEGAAEGLDFVGAYAAGPLRSGFANSLGQRNWDERYSFLLDWSLYHVEDRAVKNSYSGFRWDASRFTAMMERARGDLGVVRQEPRELPPGKYRAYLAPAAVQEFLVTLGWGGFGLRDHRTKRASLVRMSEGRASLHPGVTLVENARDGIAPGFQSEGFLKPDTVVLVEGGRFGQALVSPRSAREYGVPTNGAGDEEAPDSLDLAPGSIPQDEVLDRLGTGVYVSNLWYMNYSDREACRMTGMTRFATFWVEDGEVRGPVRVMRFDESAYRVLGEELEGLTREREMLVIPDSYGGRSRASHRVPGLLVRSFEFTL